jgi:hypothetical protein
MKKLLLVTSLMVVVATGALAKNKLNKNDDLSDSISMSFSVDNNTDHTTNLTPNISYQHDFGNGFQFGLQTENGRNGSFKSIDSKVEVDGYYQRSILDNRVVLSGGAGIGREFVSPTNFLYNSLYGNIDYNVSDKLVWYAVQYQWRDSFDLNYDFGSNQLGTGLTYKFDPRHSVSFSVYESTDRKWNKQSTGATLGYTYNF